VPGKRRDASGIAPELTYRPEDDLGPAVVALHFTVDFDLPALEASDVSDPFQVARKDDHRERTHAIVFAEVEEMHAAISLLYPQYFAGDAFGGADVLQASE
jgi:hypothetical protein